MWSCPAARTNSACLLNSLSRGVATKKEIPIQAINRHNRARPLRVARASLRFCPTQIAAMAGRATASQKNGLNSKSGQNRCGQSSGSRISRIVSIKPRRTGGLIRRCSLNPAGTGHWSKWRTGQSVIQSWFACQWCLISQDIHVGRYNLPTA